MSDSTVKKRLIELEEEEFTPAKAIVSCEINSWMQTNEKVALKKEKEVKFKICRRIPPQSQRCISQVDSTPTINDLKKRRDELMKSSLKKSGLKKSLENTKPTACESNKSSTAKEQKMKELKMRLPLFHVNEFVAEDRDIKTFQQVNLIPSNKPFMPHDPKTSSRRSTLQKIRQKEANDNIFNFVMKRPVLGEILKVNSSKKKYMGFNSYNQRTNDILRQQRIRNDVFFNPE